MNRMLSHGERLDRRTFLRLGTAGLAGLGLADLLRLEAQGAKATSKKASGVIFVWLNGGPATIDIWDLKPAAPAEIRGEFKAINTSAPGVQICEHLPKLAKWMHKATLIRSLHHSIPEHGVASAYMASGNLPTVTANHPSLGSLAARTLPPTPGVAPYFVLPGAGLGNYANAGHLGTAYNPFNVTGDPRTGNLRVQGDSLPVGFSAKDLRDRAKLRERFDARFKALDEADSAGSLDKFHHQALDILRSDRTRKAFELSKESAKTRSSYGPSSFGQTVLTARRLIEAGARFVTVGLPGWDTHAGNFNILRGNLLPQVDQALSGLIADLNTRGLLHSTIVYCAGEFNRTPRVNGTAGRDHWSRSMAVFLAGGGFARGQAYGTTDREGMAPEADPCTPDDVSATLFYCLGLKPHHEITTLTGRPIAIFREGKVLTKAVG
jgi:uncharacterized protein (DUF1501 family)